MTDPYVQDFPLTLNRFLEHAAKWHPEAGVVTATDGGATVRITYPDLLARSQRFSAGLQQLGIRVGDRVATLAWNTQAHVEAWYGIAGMGAVVHTLNPRLAIETLATMVRQAECRLIVAPVDLLSMAIALARLAPTLQRIIVIDETIDASGLDTVIPVIQHEDMLGDAPASWGDFDEHNLAGLCFTSGTTGDPKGVAYTHRSSYLHTLRMLQADMMGPSAADNIMMVVPMFHANGWGLPFAAAAVGASLVLPGRHVDGATLAGLIANERVTMAAAVPTVWLGLIDHVEANGGDVSSLKRIIVGGAPMRARSIDRIESGLDAVVQTSWGMTELTPVGVMGRLERGVREAASAGRGAVGIDFVLKDAEGKALPAQRDVEGRLHVRGQSVVHRYYGHDKPAVDAEGWFDTGDLARIGADGSIYITGRAKDLIKSGGEWINPAEIEAIVSTLPSVAMTAVIPRRHDKWGERPVLIVELRESETASDDDLLEPLRTRVPTWWMPDAVIRVPKLPLAATGKIDKRRLQAEFG